MFYALLQHTLSEAPPVLAILAVVRAVRDRYTDISLRVSSDSDQRSELVAIRGECWLRPALTGATIMFRHGVCGGFGAALASANRRQQSELVRALNGLFCENVKLMQEFTLTNA